MSLWLSLQLQMVSHMGAPLESWGLPVSRSFPLHLTLTLISRPCLKSTSCTQTLLLSKWHVTSWWNLCEYILYVRWRSKEGVCACVIGNEITLSAVTEEAHCHFNEFHSRVLYTIFKSLGVAEYCGTYLNYVLLNFGVYRIHISTTYMPVGKKTGPQSKTQ